MGITRKELDIIYQTVKKLYKRKNRDKYINKGIDAMYKAINDYIDGEKIERISDDN